MTDTSSQNTENQPEKASPGRRRGLWTLVAIILVFTTPWIFSLFWRPDGRVNYGTLVKPVEAIASAKLIDRTGAAISSDNIREKWVWFTVVDGVCSEACEANLYTMRQTRLGTGKHTKRIRYALLNLKSGSPPLRDALLAEHPLLDTWVAAGDSGDSANALRQQLETAASSGSIDFANSGVYLLDPIGHVVLHYPVGDGADQITPADLHRALKKDIGRLLRGSHVG